VDDDLALLIDGDSPCSSLSLALRRVMRSIAGITRAAYTPAVVSLDYVLVLSHLDFLLGKRG
jgi:hypothetical protein